MLTLTAAFLLGCGSNPPPATPDVREAETAPVITAAQTLTDERVLELGRGYIELLAARDFERLFQHLAPQPRERFVTAERLRSETEGALNDLGKEIGVISETVEPARQGMIATKLYLRVSRYATTGEVPVRLLIGLTSDGSIAGMQLRRGDQD